MSQIGDQPITRSLKTTSIVLPTAFQRQYDFCHTFVAGGLEIHFPDTAMAFFKSTIDSLDERSKVDSLAFAKTKLVKGKTNHMLLSFDTPRYAQKGRTVYFEHERNHHLLTPNNSLYYCIDTDLAGNIDPQDMENVLSLVEIFAKIYGPFDYVKTWNNEFIANSNNRLLSVKGVPSDSALYTKVLSLSRKHK